MKQTNHPHIALARFPSGIRQATGGAATVQRYARRLLHAQQPFLPLLTCATLAATLALVCAAYGAASVSALAGLQAQVSRDARTAEQLAAGSGDGQLSLGSGPEGNAAVLARVRDLTGEGVALYQLKDGALVAIAVNGLGAVGEHAPRAVTVAVVGVCGPLAPRTCHRSYAGTIAERDGSYVSAFVPLFDADGTFVGALGVGRPTAVALAPAAQLSVVVLFVGLLVTLTVLFAGTWVFDLMTVRTLNALQVRLAHLGAVADELGHAAATQVIAARRQERMARHITESARDLDALVGTLQQGRLSLHDSASGMWAEMSQPGVAPDPAVAMRLARQAVVLAARIGVATEETRLRCNDIVRLMNQVLAEGHMLGGQGHETERRVAELHDAIERLRGTLGEPSHRRDSFAAKALPPLGEQVGAMFRRAVRGRNGAFAALSAYGRRLAGDARGFAGGVAGYVRERAAERAGRGVGGAAEEPDAPLVIGPTGTDGGNGGMRAVMRPPGRRPPPASDPWADPWATNPRMERPRLPDPPRHADADGHTPDAAADDAS